MLSTQILAERYLSINQKLKYTLVSLIVFNKIVILERSSALPQKLNFLKRSEGLTVKILTMVGGLFLMCLIDKLDSGHFFTVTLILSGSNVESAHDYLHFLIVQE